MFLVRFFSTLFALLLVSTSDSAAAATQCDDIHLVRARFALAVADREPVGEAPAALPQRYDTLFFFTEIHDASGETLVHRWFFNDVLQAEVRLAVGGDRWRTWSRKNIGNRREGSWKVTVSTDSGCELASQQLRSDTPLPVLTQARELLTQGDAAGARLLVKEQLADNLPWQQQLQDFLDQDLALAQVEELIATQQLYMADARLTAIQQGRQLPDELVDQAETLRQSLETQRDTLRRESTLALRALGLTLTETLAGGHCPADEQALRALLGVSPDSEHWLVNDWSQEGGHVRATMLDARTGFLHALEFDCPETAALF